MKLTTGQKAIKLASIVKNRLDDIQYSSLIMKAQLDQLNKKAFRLEKELKKFIEEEYD